MSKGRMVKTRKAYVMKKRTPFHNTGPELIVRDLLKSVGLTTQRYYVPLVYTDEDGKAWSFEPDIEIPPNVVILVDGPHHFTSRFQAKDRWQNRAYASLGKKVIRVPYTILKTKALQNYAIREIQRAIDGKEMITVILD